MEKARGSPLAFIQSRLGGGGGLDKRSASRSTLRRKTDIQRWPFWRRRAWRSVSAHQAAPPLTTTKRLRRRFAAVACPVGFMPRTRRAAKLQISGSVRFSVWDCKASALRNNPPCRSASPLFDCSFRRPCQTGSCSQRRPRRPSTAKIETKARAPWPFCCMVNGAFCRTAVPDRELQTARR